MISGSPRLFGLCPARIRVKIKHQMARLRKAKPPGLKNFPRYSLSDRRSSAMHGTCRPSLCGFLASISSGPCPMVLPSLSQRKRARLLSSCNDTTWECDAVDPNSSNCRLLPYFSLYCGCGCFQVSRRIALLLTVDFSPKFHVAHRSIEVSPPLSLNPYCRFGQCCGYPLYWLYRG